MNWQAWAASLVVLLAASWIVRRVWRFVRAGLRGEPTKSCGNCGKGKDGTKTTHLVGLSPPSRKQP